MCVRCGAPRHKESSEETEHWLRVAPGQAQHVNPAWARQRFAAGWRRGGSCLKAWHQVLTGNIEPNAAPGLALRLRGERVAFYLRSFK